MNIPERVLNALLDGYEARLKAQQSAIDALAAENDRLHKHNERLTLDLAMMQTDIRRVTK